ncbi:exonuclease domain-containing protein [Rheinheimera salexigens]|uniref:DNA polymerase III subunit epsilon n=1 Tax=Rheinheimera salexigens TaxID=1628148 RepID=A0A1E7Q5U6_9GAMM|nr:exonuclease domain-containing protein [Rheinheimera salexigens]OEY69549.1 DNA polymerase III subunit epsilon [Rheinheimera salexigens]
MFNWLRQKHSHQSSLVKLFEQTKQPAANTALNKVRFLVIDLELTGLNPRKDNIVSLGWLPIIGGEIVLAQAKHYLVKPPNGVGQSAIYHGLHDNQLTHANHLETILRELLTQYAGYVFVAHYSALDRQFLRTACKQHLGLAPSFRFIDTLRIEWQRLSQKNTLIAQDMLQLSACLTRHKLPKQPNHHALEDAYGCALLLLSQIKQCGKEATLKQLYKLSRA